MNERVELQSRHVDCSNLAEATSCPRRLWQGDEEDEDDEKGRTMRTVRTMRREGRVALLVSPAAERVADLPMLLEAAGISIGEQISVGGLEITRPRGASWKRRGYVGVVAAGGDGTVSAATSQIAESDLPLGILPLGTSNDVARALGVPLDLPSACAVIASGIATGVDVGLVIPADSLSEPGRAMRAGLRGVAQRLLPPGPLRAELVGSEARFIHALTLGLNVEFARLATDVARRRRWGPLNYATATVEALTKLHPVPVTLHLSGIHSTASHSGHIEQGGSDARTGRRRAEDELVVSCQAIQVAVVNTPVFGGALNLRLPAAHPQDRLLDVVVIEALEPRLLRETVEGLLAALGTLADSYSPSAFEPEKAAADTLLVTEEAARFALPGIRHYQVRSVHIEAPSGVDITLDGEIGARTPVEVSLARKRLQVLLPAEAHQRIARVAKTEASTS